jgi:glycosyltransferase involved in cell wall biosynthesis
LSLKSAALLRWADNYCSHASYVLKIDSDVFLNTPNLIAYIEQIESNITRDGNQSTLVQPVFHCRWQEKDYVIRAWRKNNVSMEAYSMGYYPPYCSGYAYLMNIQAVRVIAAQAQNASYFANEDVLVTGFLALRAGVRHVDILPQYFNHPYVPGSYDYSSQCRACVAMANLNNYIFAHAQLYAYWSQMWTYMTTSNSTEREDINAECISACPMY